MEIYLIRHTAPDIAKGICYGQADIGVKESFLAEAAIIKKHLPQNINTIYSSPLQRCKKLAEHLFSGHPINFHNDLKEINCGQWELQPWDSIPRNDIEPWMNDAITRQTPNGESYQDLYDRVKNAFLHIYKKGSPLAIVTHGGVIRSILTHITNTHLKDSFHTFSLNYGCVIKIIATKGDLTYEVLSNILQEKETHRPSYL